MKNKKGTLKAHRGHLKATDRQIGRKHYKNFKIQPIEFITANKLNKVISFIPNIPYFLFFNNSLPSSA